MQKVGIIGWRGMVGSTLMQRLKEENNFADFKTYLFSTSTSGQPAPKIDNCHDVILNSENLDELKSLDIILTCQGGAYTQKVHPQLRSTGWNGIWIDAASSLRMNDDAIIVLDPINKNNIEDGLNQGVKNYIGGNCTVSLMLMALDGLFRENLVEWVSSMTYQAASGAGAKAMLELMDQMQFQSQIYQKELSLNPSLSATQLDQFIGDGFTSEQFPKKILNSPLSLSLLPWIDCEVDEGRSKEEWKAQVEANKILNKESIIPIDGTCTRVSTLRCHSQAFTIKLKKSVDIKSIETIISEANPWVELIPNQKEATLNKLTPAYTSGTLGIPIGRVRRMSLGEEYLNAFSVGDQLLWGAAEPLRRTLLMALS